MLKATIAARDQKAQEQIVAAAEKLAARLDLPGSLVTALHVQGRDKLVKAMQQREAISKLLDAVVEKLPKPKATKESE